ncbi:cell wall anchor protein [Chryseobacterium sp. 6424]|uniref:cell wall anchor protein n=1 Tax=Chryseobacterium sp. 6424 TaxID=2039166 RepID=UPI000EFCA67C|nr:cell wall anchor protein [Chryseobacterium sp. 6424]AYO58182.1 cell wall anchor protein [Chryseobacterium sp. 6424]
MNQIFIENLGVLLATLATGFGGWFFGRKKAQAEAESSQIENAEKLLGYYKNLVDDLGTRLESAIKKFNEAEQTIRELEERIDLLTEELKKYKQLNGKIA